MVRELSLLVPAVPDNLKVLAHLHRQVEAHLGAGEVPVRFAVTQSNEEGYLCEVGVAPKDYWGQRIPSSVFEFIRRKAGPTQSFNVVMLVPTGIGANIGGHAGDATPAARLLASCCDCLVLHPNVVNASDINEAPPNALYVEGSTITRLLMGTIGLQAVRSNRLLFVVDGSRDAYFVNATINSINAARACYGIECAGIWTLPAGITLTSRISKSGRVGGVVEKVGGLLAALVDRRAEFDAVSISSPVGAPDGAVLEYFQAGGSMLNPWGGAEALLTHTVSHVLDMPTAHSPMMESREIAAADLGIVDPSLAAEAVSLTFLNCAIKGLHKSPRIVPINVEQQMFSDTITAANIDCLVVPDRCLGLPTLAALEQSIRVIAVADDRNVMRNDIGALPWRPGQFYRAANYLEAAGLITAFRAGVAPSTLMRPFPRLPIECVHA